MTTNDNQRKRIAVTVSMSVDDVRRLDEIASAENRTRSNFIETAVLERINKNEVKA